MRATLLLSALFFLPVAAPLQAVPPLVSGDVPTAEKGTFEWYVGLDYESSEGEITRQFPTTELVYGLSDRQEITFAIPYLSVGGEHGFGDAIVGTKCMFFKETESLPGMALSFELKLPNASLRRGLGTEEFDYDFLLRVQKTWSWFTLLANAGYTIIGEPRLDGVTLPRKNVTFLSCVQEYQLTRVMKVFSEIYFETNDEPGRANRFAGDVGFDYEFREDFKIQASVGTSLRDGQRGGPDLRVYVGFEWDFDAPWKAKEK